MKLPNSRQGFLLMAAACAGAMGFALFAQHVLKLEPCPLCIFQRVGVIATGLVSLLAALVNPAGCKRRLFAAATILTAVAGASVSLRQLWLQSLPPDAVPACGPGLSFLLDALPLHQVMMSVLAGSGECAKVDWTFLGMAMPFWVLVFFAGMIVTGIWQMLRRD